MTKGKKHMGGTERCRIEFGLAVGESERLIAKAIGVSLSTVSREIRKHTYESFKGCYGRANQCARRADCKLTGICKDCPAKGAPCVRCSYRNCNRFCNACEYIDCPQRLQRTAQVGNGCPDEKHCHKRKLFYIASRAQEDYRTAGPWARAARARQSNSGNSITSTSSSLRRSRTGTYASPTRRN